MQTRRAVFLLLAATLMSGCGYHQIQAGDEQVLATASELIAISRRRLDQVPNLIQAVQTYAPNEQETLNRVSKARDATVEHMPATPESLEDQDVLINFAKGNLELSRAVGRLLVVSENYPALKADANFRDLQAQMEEAGGRIDTAEFRYVEAVKVYNAEIESLPNRIVAMLMGARPKGEFH
ncbi:MAG: LemA family protein [Proteobacteria bacterium]|nr:LemA family protein [Pseudomonadota bacterium]